MDKNTKFKWVDRKAAVRAGCNFKIVCEGHPDFKNRERNRKLFRQMYELSGLSFLDIGKLIGVSRGLVHQMTKTVLAHVKGTSVTTENLNGTIEAVATSLEERARKIRGLKREI